MDSLHLTTAHPATDTRIFDKEAVSLANEGFEISIVAHDTPSQKHQDIHFLDLGQARGRYQRFLSIPKMLRTVREMDTEIYHIHDPELIPGALYLKTVTDAAVVYDVHEYYDHVVGLRDWIPPGAKQILSRSIPRIERFAARRIDAVVPATEGIGDRFAGFDTRVEVIRNFPITSNLPPKKSTIPRSAEHVLCFVGALVEARGLYRMIDLLYELVENGMDVELWALGDWSPAEDKNQAFEYIQSRNLEKRVHFPGYLDYKRMFEYLYSADVGLSLVDITQHKRSISTKLFEYLYAGLPIVATPIDAVAEFIPEEYRKVVPQGDEEAAAAAVESLLSTDFNAKAMRKLVRERYSWEAESESLIDLYESILS